MRFEKMVPADSYNYKKRDGPDSFDVDEDICRDVIMPVRSHKVNDLLFTSCAEIL